MFDTTLQVMAIDVTGSEDHVVQSLIIGMGLPGPQGNPILIPAGAYRVPMARNNAIETGQQLIEAGEAIEEKPQSDLVVASNLQGVDRAAKMAEQFRQPSGG